MGESTVNPETFVTVLTGVRREGGSFGLHVTDAGDWTCWIHFTREAPGSPMVAGTAYGCAGSPYEALEEAARETGWLTEQASAGSPPSAAPDRR